MLFVVSNQVIAQSIVGFKRLDHVKEVRKKSILKLELIKNDKVVEVATAFFTSKDGYVLTVKHVFHEFEKRNKKSNDKWALNLRDSEGELFRNIDIVACDNSENNLDICLLKVRGVKNVKNYIPIQDGKEEKIGLHIDPDRESNSHLRYFTYGNNYSGDFLCVEYRLLRYHNNPKENLRGNYASTGYNDMTNLLELVEYPEQKLVYDKRGRIKSDPLAGFSGSPVINSYGNIVGMLSQRWSRRQKDKYVNMKTSTMAIPYKYILNFYNNKRN